MAFIGVDLHTNSFTTCRLDEDGTEAFETWQLAQADLERFCLGLDAGDEVAVEATGNSAWFCDEVRPCVGRIVVVNPKQFQVIRRSVKKTGAAALVARRRSTRCRSSVSCAAWRAPHVAIAQNLH